MRAAVGLELRQKEAQGVMFDSVCCERRGRYGFREGCLCMQVLAAVGTRGVAGTVLELRRRKTPVAVSFAVRSLEGRNDLSWWLV